jgi:hypothetical protein
VIAIKGTEKIAPPFPILPFGRVKTTASSSILPFGRVKTTASSSISPFGRVKTTAPFVVMTSHQLSIINHKKFEK